MPEEVDEINLCQILAKLLIVAIVQMVFRQINMSKQSLTIIGITCVIDIYKKMNCDRRNELYLKNVQYGKLLIPE